MKGRHASGGEEYNIPSMGLRFYNTLTRKVEEFAPLDGKTVRMYVCGPTVYDDPHIGHARSAYIFDLLHRYLQYKGFTVNFVRNVTDVDDKIIEKARHETQDSRLKTQDLTEKCQEVAEKYLQRYHETMDRLGIGRPTHEPLATGHIDEMLNLISQLVLNGSAYETKTGDVYFAVRKFPGYGRLSNRTVDDLQVGTRVEPGEHPAHSEALGGAGKQDPLDFALWKAAKPDEPAWKSPWGKGRPGWHIECSAMSTKYLGDAFDIHGGGVDLVFPHHENEVAQAHAVGKPFARFWIHNGLLTVNGEKMSKSLGNYITLEEALKACFEKADALKVFFLNAHYRSPIDYTTENALAANRRLNGLVAFLDRAATYQETINDSGVRSQEVQDLENEFVKSMDDDLNTPEALAVLDKLANWGHQCERKLLLSIKPLGTDREPRYRPSSEKLNLKTGIVQAAETLLRLGHVLGLLERHKSEAIPSEIRPLVAERQVARSEKNFQRADEIRKTIEGKGFIIDDTSGEPVVRPKPKP